MSNGAMEALGVELVGCEIPLLYKGILTLETTLNTGGILAVIKRIWMMADGRAKNREEVAERRGRRWGLLWKDSMPKGWLWDRGESGSERRVKPQRHAANELVCCLLACCHCCC
jgi:hypothetical protein